MFNNLVFGIDYTYAVFSYNMSNIFLNGDDWNLVQRVDHGLFISDLGLDFQDYMGDYVRRPPDLFHFAF